jgi:predicted adenine nucleotide alpha hydrolase (AANH) superfamily ATPase
MTNYHNDLINYISQMDRRRRLALHSCCAPCSSYVLEFLSEYFDVTVFFYNPNIHPLDEYEHRLSEQHRLCELLDIPIVECGYDTQGFFDAARGLEREPEGGERCKKCFELRLDNTAYLAKAAGFELFTATLTVSPHKNACIINEAGAAAARRYGIEWLPCDFKKRGGYQRSIELSRQYGLYRQDYCGCIFSKRD